MFPLVLFPALMAPLTLTQSGRGRVRYRQDVPVPQSSLFSPLGSPLFRFHARTQDLVGPGDAGQIVHSQPQRQKAGSRHVLSCRLLPVGRP